MCGMRMHEQSRNNHRALVSRQFVHMSRIRIEGYLAAFPKLIGTGKQHTYVETENVRYVYQPIESLYLLLVTNKQSNILEDLETLRLLSKLVPEYSYSLDEDGIGRTAFEILFAFDEVISLGHKENVTVAQIEKNRERGAFMALQSMGSGRFDSGYGSDNSVHGGSGSGNGSGLGLSNDIDSFSSKSKGRSSAAASAPPKGLGMQLGRTQKTNQFLESLKAEGEVIVEDVRAVIGQSKPAAPPPTDPVTVTIEEKLNVTLKRDGGVGSFDVQGTLSLQIINQDDGFIQVQIETGSNPGLLYKTHPNINKEMFSGENILALKDPNRPFPAGQAGDGVSLLKWRMQSADESLVPLSINCWPSVSGNETYVNLEYEAPTMFDLHNVVISIPLPALRGAPNVQQIDGEWRYDSRRSILEWSILLIDDSNRSGAMEFVIPAADTSQLFPISVQFTATSTFSDLKYFPMGNESTHDSI
ncbi:UNVERIFIED_CONTAM: Coatomer subunit delta [Sesamum calycinum]|uniref:Coatomer subunit delta n=1 Tax=Sesamum calycinum TaxID=2727403 RepID=A0AAW2SB88_9LAMI